MVLSAASSDVVKLTPRQDELLKNYKSTGKTVSSPKPRVAGANTIVASKASAAGRKKLEPVGTNKCKSAAPGKIKQDNERKRAKMISSLPNNYMTRSDPTPQRWNIPPVRPFARAPPPSSPPPHTWCRRAIMHNATIIRFRRRGSFHSTQWHILFPS